MKEHKQEKTNVMRMLDAAEISYQVMEYEVDALDLSGIHVAQSLGQDPERVFKTLVLKGERIPYLVCCIPVAEVLFETIAVSAGVRGAQIIISPEVLADFISGQFAALVVD